MEHELRINPMYFGRIADGSMTFLIRENDRGFQPGDTVVLREFDPSASQPVAEDIPKGYTAADPLRFRIGYLMTVNTREVAFSLLPPPTPERHVVEILATPVPETPPKKKRNGSK